MAHLIHLYSVHRAVIFAIAQFTRLYIIVTKVHRLRALVSSNLQQLAVSFDSRWQCCFSCM